jgi:elongation factor P
MAVISTAEFRNGSKVQLDGEPYAIVEFQHVKPGKGGAFVRTKLKNLRDGRVLERTFRAGEKLDVPDLTHATMQFLYAQGRSTSSWTRPPTTSCP